MRTKTKRTVRIEVMENAAPMEEALNRLAEAAARAGLSINAFVISVLWQYLERGREA